MTEQRYTRQNFAQGQATYEEGLTYGATEDDISQKAAAASNSQPEYEYAEPPLTGGSSTTFSSPGLESSWNPFDESFGNAYAWQKWDAQEHPSTSPRQVYSSVDCGSGSASIGQTNFSTSMSNYTTPQMSKNHSSASPYYTSEGQYAGQNSDAHYQVAISDFACQPADSSIPAPNSTKSHRQEHKHSASSSKKSGSTELSMTSNSSKPSSASKPCSSKRAQQSRVSEHNTTEKRYRGRMNDEFASLLAALPKDVVASASGGLASAERSLSKIEVLDLAKKYIDTMESDQAELEDEEQSLQAQVDFFKKVFVSCGGQLLP